MRLFTFLSILFSFGALAAGMTGDLPEVVSNRTTSDQQETDLENDVIMKILRRYLVRADGMELEPRDVICGMYSQLGNIDASFRSNPPTLDALINDKAIPHSFGRTIKDMADKCRQDIARCTGKYASAAEVYLGMRVAVVGKKISAFYTQHFRQTEETIEEVLTKPEMCGEGWKHGQFYIKDRLDRREEAKASPVLRTRV